MNYYSQGGQPHGLKSLAQELPKYGRYGDSIVAHINPQEAAMLKAMGGSGTINPVTGLPEFFFKGVSRAIAAPFKAVNQVVKAIPVIGPAIDKGLVSLDKAVGNTIPGGWNTLAQTALAFTPLGLPAKVGLAALGGSGAFGPNGKFNFQRALMSGAMAYGMNQLTAGLQNAGGGVTPGGTTDVIAGNLGVEGASTGLGSQAEMLARPEFGGGFEVVPRGLADAIPKDAALQAANTGLSNAASSPDVFAGLSGTQQIVPQPSAASNFASDFVSKTGENLAAAGRGVTNLSGFGTGASDAASAFAKPVTTSGLTALGVGTMGLASLDAQEKALNEQLQQGQINDTEYNRQMALIADGRRRAEDAMRANPYQFARGGQVDDELGGDYSAMGMDQGNLQKGLFGMGYAAGGQIKGYATGGMPDFGNGYNPFANLPELKGPLGSVGGGQRPAGMQPMGVSDGVNPFSPERLAALNSDPQFREIQRVSGGGYDAQGRPVDGLGNVIERTAPSGQSFGQTIGGLLGMMNQPAQISPSSNQNPNTNMGGFAGPSSFYGGGGGGFGGSAGGSGGPFPLEGQYGIVKMAAGGMPRFLSGGGDGMSDSIKATINDNQPARLADGEFVIPADVVSGIGNGSSKAGAKRLYGMMDRVRKDRTGTTKQAKAINPAKVMAA